ncbi:predicted protein [Uncinocarpus reesii 1704]|uniref:Uncharacterized protein n=1 Tax=Uncinocarpus reesii (strain UAMH 1704) TaxID=336963 RepID=C4JKJ0_UNCRE|nr:uncharacterized protein UREG_02147 [Uncinocarpus reesii 1704]EEP77298.1 predicted protein [Uncinocarpus reesii 1704]
MDSREKSWFSSVRVRVCNFRAERDSTLTSFHEKPPSLPSTKSVFLHLDGTKVVERVTGVGGTGIVIDQRPYALKIPRISRPIEIDGVPVATGRLTPEGGDYNERPDLIHSIQDEKAVYQRLGDHPGMARFCDFGESAIMPLDSDLNDTEV